MVYGNVLDNCLNGCPSHRSDMALNSLVIVYFLFELDVLFDISPFHIHSVWSDSLTTFNVAFVMILGSALYVVSYFPCEMIAMVFLPG